MEGTYLLDLFKSLSAEERDDFNRYMLAYTRSGKKGDENRRKLLQTVAEAAPEFLPTQINKEVVFQKVFEGESFSAGKLEKVMVDSNKFLKSFLLKQEYIADLNDPKRLVDWADLLKKRGLSHWREQYLAKLMRNKVPPRNREDYYGQFRLELSICEEEMAHNYLKGDLNVPMALESLELYYHVARLELLNQYLLQRKVTKLAIDKSIAFSLQKQQIRDDYLQKSPILLIAYKISQLLQKDLPPLADFQELSDLLHRHEANIAPPLLQQFYTYLRNFCAFLINGGKNELVPLWHQLQRDNLARGYLYHTGKRITASAYLSVATGAIRVGNLDWAIEFVESHKTQIIGDNESADLYRLNKAQYLFAIGKFELALDHIAPVFEFLNYTLLAKRLEIKILYEIESELLPYKAGAFKIFLTRASQKFMPDDLKRPNADFVNIIHQILRSKPGQRRRSERLSARIHAKPLCAERDWLLEKAAQLR